MISLVLPEAFEFPEAFEILKHGPPSKETGLALGGLGSGDLGEGYVCRAEASPI
jgi:hypothetical protein